MVQTKALLSLAQARAAVSILVVEEREVVVIEVSQEGAADLYVPGRGGERGVSWVGGWTGDGEV